MTKSGFPQLEYRPALQGLRALAVLLVLLAHSGLDVLPGGFVGVDVFFVLSGYLITGLLIEEHQRCGKISLFAFYVRRLKRLLPALLVMVSITFTAAVVLLSASEFSAQTASASYALTWVSNLFFAFREVAYFDELSVRDLYLHTWSLGVEEQFYLIWPVLLIALLGLFARLQRVQALVWGMFSIVLLGFVMALWLGEYNPQWAFYFMPARVWQFALGATVYLLRPRFSACSGLILQLFGTVVILFSAFWISPQDNYPGWLALIPSLGAGLVLVAAKTGGNAPYAVLRSGLMVWLGDRSYSLYLWHWPVLMLGFVWIGNPDTGQRVLLLLLSLLFAVLSYRWVEYPFWKGRFSRIESRTVFLVALLSILLGILYVQQVSKHHGAMLYEDGLAQWRNDMPAIYFDGCDTWYRDAALVPCEYGDPKAPRTVALIGDSIGAQWFSLFPALFSSPEWRVVVLTKSSCPVVDEALESRRTGKRYQVCRDWREAAVQWLEQLQPDLLVVGNAATYRYTADQWNAGSHRLFARFSQVATETLVLPGTPSLGFDGPGCIDRYSEKNRLFPVDACLAQGRVKKVEPVRDLLQHVTDRFANVHLLDLNLLVCPNGLCRAVTEDGVIVFRDSQHLTDSFVVSQVGAVRRKLQQILGSDWLRSR